MELCQSPVVASNETTHGLSISLTCWKVPTNTNVELYVVIPDNNLLVLYILSLLRFGLYTKVPRLRSKGSPIE